MSNSLATKLDVLSNEHVGAEQQRVDLREIHANYQRLS